MSQSITLPNSVVTRRDLSRLVEELEGLHSDLMASDIKQRQGVEAEAIRMSDELRETVQLSDLVSSSAAEREDILKKLRRLRVKAPVFHIRFASQVSADGQRQLSQWFRDQVHPEALLDIRTQPDLVGGIYVRSENQVFDMSWRQQFSSIGSSLQQQLKELV